MQAMRALAFVLFAAIPLSHASRASTSPVGKVLELLNGLKGKLQKDAAAEERAFKRYMEWCDDTSKDTQLTIEGATAQKGKLEAQISKSTADIESASMKIEELGAAAASSEADLSKATVLREKEARDFAASEKELMGTADTIDRAIKVIQRDAQAGSASLAQLGGGNADDVLASLSAVVDAASFSNADQQRLLALLQSERGAAEGGDLGAPAAAAYKTHGAGIVEMLEDLRDKAEEQLSGLRKGEAKAQHQYELLKQSLEAEMAAGAKDMAEQKSEKAAAEEAKAAAGGELAGAVKELRGAQEALALASKNCAQTKMDHEATVDGRTEELGAIEKAAEVLLDMAGPAAAKTYALVQLGSAPTSSAGAKVTALVRRLARVHHSAALAQLASQLSAIERYGAEGGADPFAKVRGLIEGMIEKLEKQAGSEATEKAYCDEEMAKSEAKRGELTDDLSKLRIKIDQSAAKSAGLKEQVKELQTELSTLIRAQAEMDQIRQESHADYVNSKADLEQGLSGVRKALVILRDYYANKEGAAAMLQDDAEFSAFMQQPAKPPKYEKSSGAGGGIIGILEVVEEDFAKGLAKEEAEEADAQVEYEKTTQENAVTKVTKDKDVEYKTKEIKSLAAGIAELASSKDGSEDELAAVNEYYAKLQERCVAKPEPHEEKAQRRAAEIQGLKDALAVLEEEPAFVQRRHHGRRHIRGSLAPGQ